MEARVQEENAGFSYVLALEKKSGSGYNFLPSLRDSLQISYF